MELDLWRYKITPHSIGGKLAVDGVFECYTLERPYDDPAWKPIPLGRYVVLMLPSGHFKRAIPHIMNVPGREAIEIHNGNHPHDTHGCVLVGKQLGDDAIWTSEVALDELCAKLDTDTNSIFINVQEVKPNEEITAVSNPAQPTRDC